MKIKDKFLQHLRMLRQKIQGVDKEPGELFAIIGTVLLIISAVAGLIYVEHLYFTNAENVRLLYVILLVPIGLLAGLLAIWLVAAFIALLVVLTPVAVVILGIYVLYRIIVWTN